MRALRKHSYRVTFAKFNPRDQRHETGCPVHAYSTMKQELSVLKSTSVGGVRFSNAPRKPEHEAQCPVGAYATIEQEIAVMPSKHSVGGVKFSDTPRDCLVPKRANCPVHVYSEAKSTLSKIDSASFSTERHGRDAFQQTERALAPVHAYATPTSTLRSAGGVAFGSTAPRDLTMSISRTGLLTATSTPRRTTIERQPRVPTSLPKLAPLPEIARITKDADDGSPRGIEAVLGM